MERTVARNVIERIDRSVSELSPPIRAVAADAVPSGRPSLPVALCTVAAELPAGDAVASSDRRADIRDPVATAAAMLEGYVRTRRALLATGGDESTADRDAAVLASDHLHASAYTVIADAAVSDGRKRELYRLLTAGSAAAARRFFSGASADESTADEPAADDPGPEALLAATAGELGAAAVGATTETRRAVRRYSRSLTAALDSHPALDDDDRAAVARILSGDSRPDANDGAGGEPKPPRDRGQRAEGASVFDRHLERARDALDALVDATGDPGSSPMRRLERATRISLQCERETHE